MRKISQTRSRGRDRSRTQEASETPPGRIAGATVTARPRPDLDLSALLLRRSDRTVTGGHAAPGAKADKHGQRDEETVDLWDGTEITFKSID